MKRKQVLHSMISIGRYREFVDEIFTLIDSKTPSYICFANVHMVMEGYQNNTFQKVMNEASVLAPDGRPISLFINYFNKIKQDRVCGMDIFPDLLKQAEASNKSIYLLGNTTKVLGKIINKIKEQFPRLIIAGSYSPPFRILTPEENITMIQTIKASAPDMIFVSLGCPKQEKWMAENRLALGSCLLGVGQAFNTYAGVEKRLPVWMQNLSLEWVYRLYTEPKRLWKRYFYTNSYFLLLTFGQLLIFWKNNLTNLILHPNSYSVDFENPIERKGFREESDE